jgi:hypothetical protein
MNEADLEQSDEAIREKIQTSRLEWTREGFEGKKSGFIILAVSPRIAYDRPSPEMRELARRLCYLYLETEIRMDHIHLDQIYGQATEEQEKRGIAIHGYYHIYTRSALGL